MTMCRILLLAALLVSSFGAGAEDTTFRDLYSDTWVATDALGRTMPSFAEVGPVKADQRRIVGIFYITWHGEGLAKMKSPYAADVTKVLAADPAARLDGKHPLWTEGSYHWGEPELGYFLSRDEFVIRKDMSMLADAGVDVLVMDVTNAVCYWDEWETTFSVMQKMKAEGNKVPQFCFWAFNGPVITVVQNLYEKIYVAEKYKDLWFYWDGKPLLLYNATPNVDSNGSGIKHPNPHYDAAAKTDSANPHYGDPKYTEEFYSDYTPEVKNYFTQRGMWWGYYKWDGKRYLGTEDSWSFGLDMGDKNVSGMTPEERVSLHDGTREEASVTPGQHPVSLIGKSWTVDKGEPEFNEFDLPVPTEVPWLGKTVSNPEGYGIYFQQRWDEALQAKPQFLYLNDWNEWSAGKYHPEEGKTYDFMRRQANYRFIDQYNSEFNRTIQPMKGGYTDNYYMQMAQNIRKYKGIRPVPELSGIGTIQIDGAFNDWNTATQEYRDTACDTAHRDYPGYGGLHYKDDSGRNDIVTAKVAVDDKNVYFYAATTAPLTTHTDPNWMLLFIDTDQNHDTGWNGYDVALNMKVKDDKKTTLSRWQQDGPNPGWTEAGQLDYSYSGKTLELAVPRALLGLNGDSLAFDFHWSDNPSDANDIISLCATGDSAPNRKFNYRCIWKR
jgi:hypothetical protein